MMCYQSVSTNYLVLCCDVPQISLLFRISKNCCIYLSLHILMCKYIHLPHLMFQWGNSTFNRAKLLNVGVREALRDEDWSCIFLHDVDLLPENDHNTYTCHKQFPTHLSVAMDKFRYR